MTITTEKSLVTIIWSIIVASCVTASTFLYWPAIKDPRVGHEVCSLESLGSSFISLLQPANWFGLLTISIVAGLIRVFWLKLSSRWPVFEDIQLAMGVLLVLVVALGFSVGCGK